MDERERAYHYEARYDELHERYAGEVLTAETEDEDYTPHLVTVWQQTYKRTWTAHCRCGWEGMPRPIQAHAYRDASLHRTKAKEVVHGS